MTRSALSIPGSEVTPGRYTIRQNWFIDRSYRGENRRPANNRMAASLKGRILEEFVDSADYSVECTGTNSRVTFDFVAESG